MEITTKQLANALNHQWVHAENRDGMHYAQIVTPDQLARDVWERLADVVQPEPDDVVDAHICCEHVVGDREVELMVQILTGMAGLDRDARQRIRNWVDERFVPTRAVFP